MRMVLLACMLTGSGCTDYIFYPMRDMVLSPDAIGLDYEDIFIEAGDQTRLHGWRIFSSAAPAASVLYFHGNAENISTHFANVYWLVEQGYEIYIFDYRGYGRSEGEAELDAIIPDLDVMIGHVAGVLPAERQMIVMGQSLGASLSIYAVAHSVHRDRLAALISVSAFSDYHDIAQDALAKSWLFWLFQWPLSKTIDNSYSPVEAIGRVAPLPVYIMHSRDDEIIDFYHAETLFEAASEPRQLIVLEGGHNATFGIDSNRERLLDVLLEITRKGE